MSQCSSALGTDVGQWKFTDQVNADDAALFTSDAANWPTVLTMFDSAAATMGLHTSGCKTLVLDHQRLWWTLPTSESNLSTVSPTLAVT